MGTVALTTVGCRLNQYETEKIAGRLVRMGLTRVSFADPADIYIINTCTVTRRADADCRKLINRVRRANPQAVLAVIGCYLDADPGAAFFHDRISLLADNRRKMELPARLKEKYPHLFPSEEGSGGFENEIGEFDESPHRPLVQIGTGCNQQCSYCIVPKVRGPLISFNDRAITDEINNLVAQGYREAVLTAVHIGRYYHDGIDLAGLVERIIDQTSLSRLRLSSLEPNELSDKLLDYVGGHPRLCRHLHLPLQSGSDRILELMCRPYRQKDYLAVTEKVKRKNGDITVGCDLIVGFPGETDRDFSESLGVLSSGLIDYGHIFSYSDRPGTPASFMTEKNHPNIIKERNRQAREICDAHRRRHYKSQKDKCLGVISERTPKPSGRYYAISDNYLKVVLPSGYGGTKKILSFIPHTLTGQVMEGRIV